MKLHPKIFHSPRHAAHLMNFTLCMALGNVRRAPHHRRGHVRHATVPRHRAAVAAAHRERDEGTKSPNPIDVRRVSIEGERDREAEVVAIHHDEKGAIDGIGDIKAKANKWEEMSERNFLHPTRLFEKLFVIKDKNFFE